MSKLHPSAKRSLPMAMAALHAQLPAPRKRQFSWTLGLLFVGGFAELATIGAVFPFLAILTSVANHGRLAFLNQALKAVSDECGLSLFTVASLLLITIAVGAAVVRLWLSWISYKFVFGAAADLGVIIYGRILSQPYSYHIMHNSSDTLAGLEKIQHVLAYVLVPLVLGFTSFALAIFIIVALVIISPGVILASTFGFILIYGGVTVCTRKSLSTNSEVISKAIRKRVQEVQEGIGGIRDVILDTSQSVFLSNFERWEIAFRRAQTVNYFISAAPRFIIEAAAIIFIALLTFYLQQRPGGLLAALPMLGAIAIGAQRLLPLCQQVYSSLSQISASSAIVFDVAELLSRSTPPVLGSPDEVVFEESIELQNVSFVYPSNEGAVLRDVSLVIAKGSRLGVIGRSGSGKSTLVDILMGLLEPTGGVLLVDNVPIDAAKKSAWSRRVAHVPQAIYLADASVAQNIAFGRDPTAIDMDRVRRAAADADIDAFIRHLPEGYATEVGERGVRLSGGQRQRLGIARALYKGADVLILDEATSALDDVTESAVMKSIARLSTRLTVVLVAHRVTTLRQCDSVIELHNGSIVRMGPYREVIASLNA